MGRPPDKRKRPLGTGADADTYTTTARHLIPHDRVPRQLSLFGEPTEPEDLMYPPRAWAAAEWHLRFTVNTMPRGRSHWWIADLRRRSA
jgi:hypothetical protein